MALPLFALLLSTLVPDQTKDLPLVGSWQGLLEAGGVELRIVFHIEHTEGGALSATLDSPDQGVTGIPFDEVTQVGDSLRLGLAVAAAAFEGRLTAADMLEGVWRQGGASFPLVLARVDRVEKPRRPQEPSEPLPYNSTEITFENETDGVVLAGTLTLPNGPGPFPAVAFISGSGAQDRDETVFGHRPFLVLSDHLTRRGIATLRYDDRGVGGSDGDHRSASSVEFAHDAAAAVAFLADRPEIDKSRIGLVGHSEGGLIAPMVVAAGNPVAFLVLIAPPGLQGRDILVSQVAAISRASGASDAQVEDVRARQRVIVDIASADADEGQKRSDLETVLGDLTDDEAVVAGQIQTLMSPWMQYFLTHDPASVLSGVGIPVLVVIGSKDLQVVPEDNVPALRGALEESGSDYELEVLQGLNHLLQESETGLPVEYGRIEQTIAPQALARIGDWITRTVAH